MKKAIVTGSNGFIGSNVCKRLCTDGIKVFVVVNCRRADIIVGPIGIVIADALLGEITSAMATAVCQSSATRVLIPVNHCENYIVGVPDQPISALVAAAVQKVKALCNGEGC